MGKGREGKGTGRGRKDTEWEKREIEVSERGKQRGGKKGRERGKRRKKGKASSFTMKSWIRHW